MLTILRNEDAVPFLFHAAWIFQNLTRTANSDEQALASSLAGSDGAAPLSQMYASKSVRVE